MLRGVSVNRRSSLIFIHDLIATAAAVVTSFFIRFEETGFADRGGLLAIVLPAFIVWAGCVYWYFELYRSKWRFASLPDLFNIFRAVSILALTLLVLDYVLVAPNVYGTFFFGKITILLYWFLQMFFLGGPRVAYRYFRYTRDRQHAREQHALPVLILGRAADAEILLRAMESGAVQKIMPVGILSPSPADRGHAIRGISVFGNLDDLERAVIDLEARGIHVSRLVFTPSALAPEAKPETILMRARRLGLTTSRLPALDSPGEALRLAPIAVEDLLLRPTVQIDYARLGSFVRGQRVLVTGGGGSIGAEICDRVISYGAAHLMVVENSEPALNAVLETLATKRSEAAITGKLADVRDQARIASLMEAFRPDIVFHAAALKHVPILEQDWGEGVKTNVFGSINVAEAAVRAGAKAMVMISTDKAIEPVSVLGATKRFAEMYCQALDADLARRAEKSGTRLLAVRFGNVLASNGSVVPKFKAQIEAGGPVTVTHPEMVRYFMTIREACDLVVTAASHALAPVRSDVSVYVLNMGQPVKILDLAERMIRLSGLEPGHDIQISFSGIRAGERLNEVLFASEEPTADIGIAGIVAAKPVFPSIDVMRGYAASLERTLAREDRELVLRALREAVPDFQGVAA